MADANFETNFDVFNNLSAAGVVYGSKRTRHYLVVRPGESPIGCQLYGGDPQQLADAAAMVEETGRFDFVDINCGCPVPKIITKGALNRNESRGAHYKPDYPDRDDDNWLKTTIAEYKNGEPELSYEEVDIGIFKPVKRDYTK